MSALVLVAGTGGTGGGLTDGPKGDITVSASGNVLTVIDKAISNAKQADMPPSTIKANPLSVAGAPQDLSVTALLSMLNIKPGETVQSFSEKLKAIADLNPNPGDRLVWDPAGDGGGWEIETLVQLREAIGSTFSAQWGSIGTVGPAITAQADLMALLAQKAGLALRGNGQNGTSYTLSVDDGPSAGGFTRLVMTSAQDNQIILPNDTTAALPVGSIVYLSRIGTGVTTITPDSNVAITKADGSPLTIKQFGLVLAEKINVNAGTTQWRIYHLASPVALEAPNVFKGGQSVLPTTPTVTAGVLALSSDAGNVFEYTQAEAVNTVNFSKLQPGWSFDMNWVLNANGLAGPTTWTAPSGVTIKWRQGGNAGTMPPALQAAGSAMTLSGTYFGDGRKELVLWWHSTESASDRTYLGPFTWAGRPAANAGNSGMVFDATDIGPYGLRFLSDGTRWRRTTDSIFWWSNGSTPLYIGDDVLTVQSFNAGIPSIPAGLLEENDSVQLAGVQSHNVGSGTKVTRFVFGADSYPIQNVTGATFSDLRCYIGNAGSLNVQTGFASGALGGTSGLPVRSKTNTANAVALALTGAFGAADGRAITSITRSGTTVTVNFAAAHGFALSTRCLIVGNDSAPAYNGLWIVETVPTTTSLTFTIGSTPANDAAPTGTALHALVIERASVRITRGI